MLTLTMTVGDPIIVDLDWAALYHLIHDDGHVGFGRSGLIRVPTDGTVTVVHPDHIVSAVETA